MRSWAFLLAIGFLACNKSAASPPGPSELVGKLDALADRVCACKDLACADKAQADLDALAAHTTHVADDEVAPAQAAQARFDGCHAARNPLVAEYQELMTAACACKDQACGAKVAKKVEAWAAALKASHAKPSRGDVQVLVARGKEAADCFTRVGVAIPK